MPSPVEYMSFYRTFFYFFFMKKIILYGILGVYSSLLMANGPKPKHCGKYKEHNLYKGEKGGCYYLKTKKKEKVYVDKKYCNC